MNYEQHINNAALDTAKKMYYNGFHDDDIFIKDLIESLINSGGSLASKTKKLAEIWTRNRKLARIALIHSELSEMVEGIRKNRKDPHLPDRKNEEVELADTLIRMEDYAGTYGLDLGGARVDKERYNDSRPYKHGKLV